MLSALAVTLVTTAWADPKYKVLHSFTGGKDGGGLWGSLLLDKRGNLYGTTALNTVFELIPGSNGGWRLKVLHTFNGNDGSGPMSGLIFDPAGNLYGTTPTGGAQHWGTVFRLSPSTHGWKETVLHSFGFNSQGCCPWAGVVMDNAGNLFGTAGVAFELSPGDGGWKETVLHDFTGQHGDGSGPYAVTLDGAGNLYGETNMGGTSTLCGGGCGTVYELRRTSGGGWKEHILHDFGTGGDELGFPGGTLVLDQGGNLYGTAGGGRYAHGAVYRLRRQSDGRWKTAIQHSFSGGAGGDGPSGGVAMDPAGNLYGVTTNGGDANCGCGVVYKLKPSSGGKWTYTVLHRFTGYDGAQPIAQLILDRKGNLYGTTITGGAGGYGVAFEITP